MKFSIIPISSRTKFQCSLKFVTVIVILLSYAGIVQLPRLFHSSRENEAFTRERESSNPELNCLTSKLLLPSICANESCRLDYVKQLHSNNIFPIPKIRHILWRNEFLSAYFAQQLSTWQKFHPDWIYVLWRDEDMEPFVASHFPEYLAKFKSLMSNIMRIDMIRFMLLLKFGGTYADLDYSLTQSLNGFRRFHAVVTREPEAHSLHIFGPHWPIIPMASPAFMMSAPGHNFNRFVLHQLNLIEPYYDVLGFSGPVGLTVIMEKFKDKYPMTTNSMKTVYMPPSFSFYPYFNNTLNNTSPYFKTYRKKKLESFCTRLSETSPSMERLRRVKNLTRLCSDITSFDPITDSSPPVFAIHDMLKSGTSWEDNKLNKKEYLTNLGKFSALLRNFWTGKDFSESITSR